MNETIFLHCVQIDIEQRSNVLHEQLKVKFISLYSKTEL